MRTAVRFSMVFAFGAALAVTAAGATTDATHIYDVATLEREAPHYQASTERTLAFVKKAMYADELAKLSAARLDFPMFARREEVGDYRNLPLAFYHYRKNGSDYVVMPILSLKFLDDLCTAYAWMQINGYVLDTVSEYTAMLAFHDFHGQRQPVPLKALGIPADALQDPKVNELALDHFVTARMFLLLHELGHAYGGPDEAQADEFAARVIQRTPIVPLGILVFFMADASWNPYPPTSDPHPVTGARVLAVAAHINDPSLRAGLQQLGTMLKDDETRKSQIIVGKATDESMLAPRRRGQLPVLSSGRPTGAAPPIFSGTYVGRYSQRIDPGNSTPVEIAFRRDGNRVTGVYSFGLGVGTIRVGTISGSRLDFEWQWGSHTGKGTFQASADGSSFAGTWGWERSQDNGGAWDGHRTD
jgi:hypothetical protein